MNKFKNVYTLQYSKTNLIIFYKLNSKSVVYLEPKYLTESNLLSLVYHVQYMFVLIFM